MSGTPTPSRRQHLAAFSAYILLTLAMTWPVVARLSTHLAGGRDDLWVHQWTFWWVRQALQDGLNPFFTPYLYFPEGASLTSHNIAWFNIALWLPLQALVGRISAYNLVFLVVIALNAYCMYLFALAVIEARIPAFVAGLIFGFWPYTLSHYDHANMMVVFWVPLALYFLHQLIQRSSHGSAAPPRPWSLMFVAAAVVAMIGITRWQLLIMSAPILLAYSIFLLLAGERQQWRETFLRLLFVAAIAALLMAPFLAPLVVDQFTRDFPQDVFLDEPQWGRTDLLAYFVPSIHNGFWRARVAPLYEHFVVNQFYTPYLGYTTLLLASVAVLRRWRQSWLWVLLGLMYVTLALGPELAVGGRTFPQVPMPYRLVEDFFLLRLLRRPDRLNLFLGLPLAMLAGWGLHALLSVLRSQLWRSALVVAVIGLILFAYLPLPFATTAPDVPAWYQGIAAEDPPYGALDLPANDRSYDKWYMWYQTVHGKPLAMGHVSRLPREALAFVESVPLLGDLETRDQLPDPEKSAVTEELRPLHDAGIRYLVLHKQFANEGLQAAWRDWLTFEPVYEDDQLIVYRTSPRYGEDFTFAYPLDGELGLIGAAYAPREGIQGGTIKVDARWGTALTPDEDLLACLALVAPSGEVGQQNCLPPGGGTPTSQWLESDVRRSSLILPLGENVKPGDYTLQLSLQDALENAVVGRRISLGPVSVLPFNPQYALQETWGDEIRLRGFDLNTTEQELALNLYWQALGPITSSYKVFVHLLDAATGEIVAQSDTIPRSWSYPTNAWEPGEIVRDPLQLSLADMGPGTYELRVGWYDEQTGQRIPLSASAVAVGADHLSLMEVER